jgi:hypothetical protein
MARTTQQIFDLMKANAIANATEAGNADAVAMFNNTSKVAVWRILFYSIAYINSTTEVVYDSFVLFVQNLIADLVPGTVRWYRKKILAFQYGFPLITDTDKFDNTGYTTDQIEDSKIVKYCAVNEATVDQVRVLLIKVAGELDGEPVELTSLQVAAIQAYVDEFKYAGVKVLIYNQEADLIRATLNVYYNPLLLDSTGNRTDGGGGKPVEDAAKAFAFNLDFNGEFIVARFVDAVQNAYGVSRSRVDLLLFQKKTGVGAFTSVSSSFIPDAGYAKFDTGGLTINYIADVVG